MEQEYEKLANLQQLTINSFRDYPNNAQEAIDEYYKNIQDQLIISALKERFNDEKYLEQFKVAITQTALMVFVILLEKTQPHLKIDIERYIREFLAYSQQDDKDIYDMRKLYLSNLNADKLEIGKRPAPPKGEVLEPLLPEVQQAIDELKTKINDGIQYLLNKYLLTKIHL